jgi:hypothetical protein
VARIKSTVNSAIVLENSLNQTAEGLTPGSLTVNGSASVSGSLSAGGKGVIRFGGDWSGNYVAAAYWWKNNYDGADRLTIEKL